MARVRVQSVSSSGLQLWPGGGLAVGGDMGSALLGVGQGRQGEPRGPLRKKAFFFEWAPGPFLYSWRVGTQFLLELVISHLPLPTRTPLCISHGSGYGSSYGIRQGTYNFKNRQ